MQGILEKLRRDARENPNRAVYNFLDCETEPFGQNVVTMGQLHARATDIAADLKRKGAKRGTARSSCRCRTRGRSTRSSAVCWRAWCSR
ncbi:MAG: hypothetical protein ACLVL7_02005 [Anaerotruncus massiliensis (ex Togo et al. 2019)]